MDAQPEEEDALLVGAELIEPLLEDWLQPVLLLQHLEVVQLPVGGHEFGDEGSFEQRKRVIT